MSLVGAPNWKLVHFDVACARCGCDVRGLDEPRCPTCGFEFDWAEAVPLEELTCPTCGYHLCGLNDPRCPECGGLFIWDDVLAWYRRRKSLLFEHRWRDRPVRSFLISTVKSLRPGLMWKQFSIHDPVPVRPLLALVLLSATLSAAVALFVVVVVYWLFLTTQARNRAEILPLLWLLERLERIVLDGPFPEAAVSAASCCLFSLAALLIFQQSMRRYRVRTGHVIRVWAYAVTGGLVSIPAVLLVPAAIHAFTTVPELRTTILVICVPVAVAASTIRYGYRDYLKMDHSLAVAASSQFIAVLATLLVWLNVFLIK